MTDEIEGLTQYGDAIDDENRYDWHSRYFSHMRWHRDDPPIPSCEFCRADRAIAGPDDQDLFAVVPQRDQQP